MAILTVLIDPRRRVHYRHTTLTTSGSSQAATPAADTRCRRGVAAADAQRRRRAQAAVLPHSTHRQPRRARRTLINPTIITTTA